MLPRLVRAFSVKSTTGIAGLAVHSNPRAALAKVYESTLGDLEALPKDHVYRAAVEKITLARLDIVRNSVTDVDAEKAIACGQMEELLVQAQDEAALVQKMQSWKAWEPLEVKPAANQWVYFK